jgi:hypothetical protein
MDSPKRFPFLQATPMPSRFHQAARPATPLSRPLLRRLLSIPCRHIDFDAHLRHIPLRRGADSVREGLVVELKRRRK